MPYICTLINEILKKQTLSKYELPNISFFYRANKYVGNFLILPIHILFIYEMEGRKYLLVNFLLIGVNSLITTAYQCESPVFLNCTCQSGEREGLLLICNRFPAVNILDEEALNVMHIFIKGKMENRVSYQTNLWPRLETVHVHQWLYSSHRYHNRPYNRH